MVGSRPRHRAQLIILGCIALAFIVVSLGLIVNTSLYTESTSQANSNAHIDSSTTLNLETERGVRSIVHRTNLGPRERDENDVHADAGDAVGNFSTLLTEHYVQSDAAVVDVRYNEDGTTTGTRIAQTGDGEFYDGEIEDLDDQRTGWFVLNANVSETAEGDINPFELVVDNGSGEFNVTMYRNESTAGSEPNMTIETQAPGESPLVETVDPYRNRVVFDVQTGDLIVDRPRDASLHSLSDLEPPYESIDAERPDKFDGQWEFVTNESSGVSGSGDTIEDCTAAGLGEEDPCRTHAVWAANVTAELDGEDTSFRQNRTVRIYGGSG